VASCAGEVGGSAGAPEAAAASLTATPGVGVSLDAAEAAATAPRSGRKNSADPSRLFLAAIEEMLSALLRARLTFKVRSSLVKRSTPALAIRGGRCRTL
jgi:hypothetical protein